MAVSRERAGEILAKAVGACSHWSRPVVLAEEDGRPSSVAFRDFEGADRVVTSGAVVAAFDVWKGSEGASGVKAGSVQEADQVVQCAAFGRVRYTG